MNFIYKIYSGYDGFYPKRIPARLSEDQHIILGWKRYLDEVEIGDDVWVYFHGPHSFKAGVYIKGRVTAIDANAEKVRLNVYDYDTSSPLTDEERSSRIASIVSVRRRQVFLFPDAWATVSDCDIFATADSCRQRHCEWCSTWKSLRRIEEAEFRLPAKLSGQISIFIPAYWCIPSRCYLSPSLIQPSIRQVTQILKAFKTGNANLAYPLARAMFESITDRGLVSRFDYIVPIPLSPDKAIKGEIHRTRLLAQELSTLSGIPLKQAVKLTQPISKRRMLSQDYTYAEFETAYYSALAVDGLTPSMRILLIDDVCTHGGTLKAVARKLRTQQPDLQISAAAAVQMIVKSALLDESSIRTS